MEDGSDGVELTHAHPTQNAALLDAYMESVNVMLLKQAKIYRSMLPPLCKSLTMLAQVPLKR
jgi:hypothetical protein